MRDVYYIVRCAMSVEGSPRITVVRRYITANNKHSPQAKLVTVWIAIVNDCRCENSTRNLYQERWSSDGSTVFKKHI